MLVLLKAVTDTGFGFLCAKLIALSSRAAPLFLRGSVNVNSKGLKMARGSVYDLQRCFMKWKQAARLRSSMMYGGKLKTHFTAPDT